MTSGSAKRRAQDCTNPRHDRAILRGAQVADAYWQTAVQTKDAGPQLLTFAAELARQEAAGTDDLPAALEAMGITTLHELRLLMAATTTAGQAVVAGWACGQHQTRADVDRFMADLRGRADAD